MSARRVVPNGTRVKLKNVDSFAEYGVVIDRVGDGEPATHYMVRTALDGIFWLFRDQFTIDRNRKDAA